MHTLERIQIFLSILVCTFLNSNLGYCIKNTKSYLIGINYGNELDNNIRRYSNFFCNYSSNSFSHKFKKNKQRKHWVKFHFILYGLIENTHPSDSYFYKKSYLVILNKTPHFSDKSEHGHKKWFRVRDQINIVKDLGS